MIENDHEQLVGGIPTRLKNMKVSWDDFSQYMENKKCSNHQPEKKLKPSFAQRKKQGSQRSSGPPLPIHKG